MNGFVKVITGIRRCGKSYLLDTLFRERLLSEGVTADHIISVDLDDKKFFTLRNPLQLDEYVRGRIRKGKKPYYVFIVSPILCGFVRLPMSDERTSIRFDNTISSFTPCRSRMSLR